MQAVASETMQAVVHDRYGAPAEVLAPRRLPLPAVGDDEVLVRVRAAGLHVGDCFAVRGAPAPLRLVSGLRRPRYGVPGLDVAGHVETVGARVGRWQPGDEVFGACAWPSAGGCAEYARTRADHLVAKPADLSFTEAAAIPTSALAALHGLRDAGRLTAGQRVLVNGASGGVGTFAVQIAKALGAEVTGVCSAGNVELVRSLGADHVIDHTAEDFTAGGARYDLILDNVENRRLADVRRAVTPTGTLVLNSGTGPGGWRMAVRYARPLVVTPFSRQRLRRYLSNPSRADLEVLAGLVEEGTLRPVVGRTYPLAEAAAALAHIETGRARGKTVVVAPGDQT